MINSGHSGSEPEGLQRVRDVADVVAATETPQSHILVGQRILTFPSLHLYTFDTLAIPAMSAGYKRVISSIKKLITPERNRLIEEVIKPIKLSDYPAVGQALGRARACLGSEDHWCEAPEEGRLSKLE